MHFKEGLPRLLQYCKGGVFPNITILHKGGVSLDPKGAGTFQSASQSKEGSVGFGTSQHPIVMKLLPDHLWH